MIIHTKLPACQSWTNTFFAFHKSFAFCLRSKCINSLANNCTPLIAMRRQCCCKLPDAYKQPRSIYYRVVFAACRIKNGARFFPFFCISPVIYYLSRDSIVLLWTLAIITHPARWQNSNYRVWRRNKRAAVIFAELLPSVWDAMDSRTNYCDNYGKIKRAALTSRRWQLISNHDASSAMRNLHRVNCWHADATIICVLR